MGILDKTMDWLEEKLEPVNSSMDIITTPAGPTTEDPLFRDAFFHPSLIPDSEPCKAILHYHLGNTNLRVWDLIILIPNLAFLLFIFYKLPSTRLKLRATNSELFRSLYSIVLTCSLASALRCLMSMMLHLDSVEHDLANKGVWVTTRFLLLTAAGSAMLAISVHPGLCLTNLTSFASFSLLSPLIFGCFLHNWFAATQPNLLFAYKAQLDDGEEEPSSIINMSRDEDVVEDSHVESLIGRQN